MTEASKRPAAKTPAQWDALVERLAYWYAMTEQERLMAGEPVTVSDWARRYEVSRRWVQMSARKPEFEARLAKIEATRAAKATVAVPVLPQRASLEQSNTEIFGEVVRSQLVAAAAGDKVALDFIKTANISKPFVDALSAEFQTEFPDSSDAELAAMFVDAFPELCADALRASGWSVSPPGSQL
jgi:hypothetical protein